MRSGQNPRSSDDRGVPRARLDREHWANAKRFRIIVADSCAVRPYGKRELGPEIVFMLQSEEDSAVPEIATLWSGALKVVLVHPGLPLR